MPIGLVFVGNDEFSLSKRQSGVSVLSAAVADRALHIESYTRDDLSDSDVHLYLKARELNDDDLRATVIRSMKGSPVHWSLRRAERIADDLDDHPAGKPFTADQVNEVLAFLPT